MSFLRYYPLATFGLAALFLSVASSNAAPYFGNGTKVGEVDSTSAIIWTRLTAEANARFDQLPIFTEGLPRKVKDNEVGPMQTDVLPGMDGQVRLTYWPENMKQLAESTGWVRVNAGKDHTTQIRISDLRPGTLYKYHLQARKGWLSFKKTSLEGQFQTAPAPEESAPVRFIVTTCQAVRSIDSGAEGHEAYVSMLRFNPHFFVHTGDIIYYDKAPLAKTVAQARAKWNLMFAYGHNRHFHTQVTSYFMKDDHDTLKNDCWPGQTYGEITFAEGLDIFREQVPMGEKTYRSYRWGKDVHIWMTENRDFRSANNIPDGPKKTILGQEQLQWLMDGIAASDAKHKFLITPGPIVGPDKRGKNDNHSNPGFQHEGQQFRDFLSQIQNLTVITGDRHWQYHSIDPKTGLHELGCGPINDEHNYGGNPGYNEVFHQYFDPGGGYLGVTVENGQAKAQWFKAELNESGQPAVRHETEL